MRRPESPGLAERVAENGPVPTRWSLPPKCRPFLGFFYTFLTCLFYSLAAVIVKKLPYISPSELTLVRNAGIFAGVLPVATYSARDDGGVLGESRCRGLLLVRALLGGFALLLATTAVAYLPLAEATTVMATFPVVTAVLARVFLKEECGLSQGALLFLAVCGVLIALRVPALLSRDAVVINSLYALGIAAAVGSVLFQSTVFVIVRRVRHLHFSVPALYYGVVGAALSASVTGVTGGFVAPRCGGRDGALLVAVGALSCLGNLLNTAAVQVEGTGIVAALRTMQIVMAMAFQALVLDSVPDAYNVCGGCLVVLSLAAMGLRKWMLTLPAEARARRQFKYLLY